MGVFSLHTISATQQGGITYLLLITFNGYIFPPPLSWVIPPKLKTEWPPFLIQYMQDWNTGDVLWITGVAEINAMSLGLSNRKIWFVSPSLKLKWKQEKQLGHISVMWPLFICLSFCSAAQTAWSRTWTEKCYLWICVRVSPVFTTWAHRFSNRVADIYPCIDFGPLGWP